MKFKFTFKDGLEVTQGDQFSSKDKSSAFYALSNSFKNNADFNATDSNGITINRKFQDVKKIEVVFDD